MPRTRLAPVLLAALALVAGLPASAPAQYMYLDANGDGVHTAADVLQPSGPTTFDVWLVTNRDRAGTLQACAADGTQPLSLLSYEFILHATNGTVTYGTLTNQRTEFTTSFGAASDTHDFHAGFGGTSPLLPGTYRLATIVVTPAGGTPALTFASSTPLDANFFTAFGSECPGADTDFTLKLGSDWMDSDGAAYGGAANNAPVLAPLADATVPEGTTMDVGLTATDLDGEPLSFSLSSGPSYAAVTTTDPGTGTASGNLHLAPGYSDAGSAMVTVAVSDALTSDTKSMTVTVPDVNRPPALMQPSDMMPYEGTTLQQIVSASDPDGQPLSFYKDTGPMWMAVTTQDPGAARGMIELSPPAGSMGSMTAVLGVTDGSLADTKSFTITVRVPNQPPMLRMPGNQFGEEGDMIAFTIMAMDADGDPVTITATGVPMGARFTDLGGGDATFLWVPNFVQAGSYPLTVTASDNKGGSETETMGIFINQTTRDIALAQPYDMTAPEGGSAEQALLGYDASGDPLTFEKVAGPAYLTVTTVMPGAGYATGRARIAPGFGDAGSTVGTIAVTDGVLRHERNFGITVGEAGQGPGQGEPPFVPPFPVLTTGMTPHTVAMGDLNGDGKPDLAVACMNSNFVSVFPGDGDGTFGMRQNYMTGSNPHTVAIGDLNGDGKPDLAVTNMGENSVGTMMGRGDGTFMMMRKFPMSGSPMILQLADLDGDGDLDMAVSNQSGNTMVVMRGNGDGTFTEAAAYPAGEHPHGIVVGDMDDDGDLDVVMACDVSLTVCVYRNRGNGTFDRLADFATSAPHYLEKGDWNGDGRMDVAIANLPAGTVSVCLGNGDGTFTQRVEMMTGAGAHGVHAGDLDGDGLEDLMVANQTANTLSVFMGRGDGTFAPKVDYMANAGAHSIALGDLDDDGDPDAVVSGINANSEIVLINQRPPVLPARAFTAGGDKAIRLMSDARPWTVDVEPVMGGFQVSDVIPSSVALISTGTGSVAKINATTPGKPLIAGDRDRNGVQDLEVPFAVGDLRKLFDQLRGRSVVTATLQGDLVNGGRFRTQLTVSLMNMPPGKATGVVTVAPNPLNPEAVIRFDTERPGAVRVRIFDPQGRLVRTLLDDGSAAAGAHAVRFDGLDARGTRLGSGVYFFRVETPDGVRSGRFAILK